ncbi:kinesin family protein [Niveomyces insectorum RCEF 264]|uniref:Kinesin-like protein n=1 Tax=Niveomyces insectorum RCEF 264 TaxID=1081102 RepID=A0A167PCL0_9HYPO|nr:kinesin family protein [Niveomyces insectorum RCEF 264]
MPSGLQEMTESQHNSRSQSSMMRIPAPTGIKRPGVELSSQPDSKRQTLVERAAEYNGKHPVAGAAATVATANGVKGVSIASLASKTGKLTAKIAAPSGQAPRSAINAPSRLLSSSSHFAQSVGPGAATQPFKQSVGARRPAPATRHRPATAMGQYGRHITEEDIPVGGKERIGTVATSSNYVCYLRDRKQRRKPRTQWPQPEDALFSDKPRQSSLGSLTSRFDSLTVNDHTASNMHYKIDKDQAVSVRTTTVPHPASASDWVTSSPLPKSNGPDEFGLPHDVASTLLDVDERLREVESQFSNLKDVMSQSLAERKSLEDVVELAKTRANDLQRQRDHLETRNLSYQTELETLRQQLQSAIVATEGERRDKAYKLEDQAREHRRELDDLRREFKDEADRLQRAHHEALDAMERHYKAELDDERTRTLREAQELKTKLNSEQQDLHLALQEKSRELQQSREVCSELRNDLDREREMKAALQKRLAEVASVGVDLEERVRTLQAQVDFLKSDSRQQSDQFAEMEARMQQALKVADESRQKLIKEETERRILFNKYQELKGNIRVMCRVRPASDKEGGDEAKIAFPDAKTSSSQIDVVGPEEKSSLGVVNRRTIPFEFDRVFTPSVCNEEVFDEISQLVQSALDGYNVCIFCYGQTGSGKTYTMSSSDGVIPRATHMIYDNIKRLEEKSWSYTMEGSFVEVYNEELHDLLAGSAGGSSGKEPDVKKKLEVRHDEARKSTTVVNCRTVRLDSSNEVESILQLAQSNRSVAATKANERSSRSHSVFILKLAGENAATGERCEGTLNLVDLAGSERLKHSGAEGDRKKETQNINKSLACLGDVIEALGRNAPHVPYRNSKLTHLLQYSLGGNSKTLMFVMISPLEEHLKETLTSLRFATKVHNTHIGTAKSTKKIKERASDAS